jgi:hypothetical protein
VNDEWELGKSGRGDGVWFFREDLTVCEVIAPPGVRALPARHERPDDGVSGWRLVRWVSEDDDGPLIDLDPPAEVRLIETTEALQLLGARWRAQVRIIMVDQLQQAMAFGRAPGGLALAERHAHAGAQAVDWILAQLRDAYPEEAWDLPASPPPAVEIPATVQDLISRIPMDRLRREGVRVQTAHAPTRPDPSRRVEAFETARAVVARQTRKALLRGWCAVKPMLLYANERLETWAVPPEPHDQSAPFEERRAGGGMLQDPDRQVVVGRR